MHTRGNRNALMRRRLTKTAILIGLTIAAPVSVASAAEPSRDACAVYAPGGQWAAAACFHHYGEHVDVCDYRADGMSAVGLFNGLQVWASGGAGTCVSKDLAFTDGTPVLVQACVGERARPNQLTCGEPVWGVA